MPTPNPSLRREYKGAAAATTLQNSMTNADTTFVLISNTNWPTGAVGKFIVTINRGQADEEKILCDTQSTRTVACLLANRGFDGTTAQSHAAGATVECTISAFDADEWNQHTNATGAVHGVAGSVVGTSDAQTLTNKTLTSPTTGGVVTETGVHSPDVNTHVALTVQGLASQSGDLQQWNSSTPAVLAKLDSNGAFFPAACFVNGVAYIGARLSVIPNGISDAGIIVRGFSAGQSASLQEWQVTGGTPVAKVDAAGNIFATNLTNAWTAYTPTFTNVTSPVASFKYLLIGKTLLIRGTFTSGTATGAGTIAFTLPGGLSALASEGLSGGNALVAPITSMPWTVLASSPTIVTSGTAYTASQAIGNAWVSGTIELA